MNGCRIAPEGLGREITHLPLCLQGIHSQHYGLDPNKPSIRKRAPTALRLAVWGRKVIPITDVTNTALRKEEMAVRP
jgi:hypothetical protein